MDRPNKLMSVPPEDDWMATQIYQLTLSVMYLADVIADKENSNG